MNVKLALCVALACYPAAALAQSVGCSITVSAAMPGTVVQGQPINLEATVSPAALAGITVLFYISTTWDVIQGVPATYQGNGLYSAWVGGGTVWPENTLGKHGVYANVIGDTSICDYWDNETLPASMCRHPTRLLA